MMNRYKTMTHANSREARALTCVAAVLVLLSASPSRADDSPSRRAAEQPPRTATTSGGAGMLGVNRPVEDPEPTAVIPGLERRDVARTIQTVALFGLISLAPVALLMVTAFVRINIVLTLLRQALGSPQIPGNQVLSAMALLLTALVMWPYGETVYRRAIQPYRAGQVSIAQAWSAGSGPIKGFMVEQIKKYGHEDYLETLYEYAAPPSPGQAAARPGRAEDFPLRVVMPAYLLSELTIALMMGFYLYLPFLVIDLVVSAVLAATGLFMLPPTLVATPVKLIVFVLADGWILVADMLLSSFAVRGGP